MNVLYDEKLLKIPFYQLHPSYLPSIGDRYDEYKILQIGDSHYCNMDITKYNVRYFSNWFDQSCDEVEKGVLGGNITRDVVNRVISDSSNETYTIFDNALRSFLKVVNGEENVSINSQRRKEYDRFAFMNFFPLPSFSQDTFLKSVYGLADDKELVNAFVSRCKKEATRIVDSVIEVIAPRCVAFTSIDAWMSYKECQGKYCDNDMMIFTSHPGMPFSWNKALSSLDDKTGKEVFEAGLARIYGKST